MIRSARMDDLSRIAEILVFSKRTAYRSIFCDDVGSFNGLQVLDIIEAYRKNAALLDRILVYDDGIVKGVMNRRDAAGELGRAQVELCELYVEPFFTGRGVGHALMRRLIEEAEANGKARIALWVLEENAPARRFYASFGFSPSGERQTVDGTDVTELRYYLELPCGD